MKMKRLPEREWDSPNPTRLSDLMVLCSVHATGGRVKVTVFKAGGGKEGKKLSLTHLSFLNSSYPPASSRVYPHSSLAGEMQEKDSRFNNLTGCVFCVVRLYSKLLGSHHLRLIDNKQDRLPK